MRYGGRDMSVLFGLGVNTNLSKPFSFSVLLQYSMALYFVSANVSGQFMFYCLSVVNPDNNFEIFVDQISVSSGNLLEDMT